MEFREIIKENKSKNKVLIGFDGRKTKHSINFKDNSSVIITGETGSGKSILLDQILCQLIENNTSLELELALIDSSGVELNYYANTRYAKLSAMSDNDEAAVVLSKVLDIMDERYKTINSLNYLTVDEYNKEAVDPIPTLVLAIDDNGTFISSEDISKSLTALMSQGGDVNIYLIGAFSNTDNYFFKSNKNLYSPIIISFDMSDTEHAAYANVPGAENLPVGKFIIKEDNVVRELFNFDFEDKIILEILNK